MNQFRSFFAPPRPRDLRGVFVFHTRNPFTAAKWGLPEARRGKFFMAELDNLWRLDRAEADRILTEYVAAGYTSVPTGPIVEDGYHKHYPDTNWLGDADGFADFLEWLLEFVEPRLFLLPDIEPWFKGTGVGWDWNAVERDLTPFYRHPRIQSAVRHTRTAWEQWAPIAEMAKAFRWQAALFPQASNLYHNAPNHLGPGNSDEDEGACWRSALANGCGGLAIQTVPPTEYGGGINAHGRTAAGQHRYDIWDMLRRFGRTSRFGPEGQRPDRVWGDLRCLDGSLPVLDYEEGCAFADYWHDVDATSEYSALAEDEGARFVLDGTP